MNSQNILARLERIDESISTKVDKSNGDSIIIILRSTRIPVERTGRIT
jgi:hypothetical protein